MLVRIYTLSNTSFEQTSIRITFVDHRAIFPVASDRKGNKQVVFSGKMKNFVLFSPLITVDDCIPT